jgi:pentatricopeptide repeat protein
MKPMREKIEDTINKWEKSICLQKVNNIIKHEVNDTNFDPFTVLDQLQKNSITPDIAIINTLLDTTSRLKDFKNFNRMCELICSDEAISQNLPSPNIITYNIILKGTNMEMNQCEFVDRNNFVKFKVEKIIKQIEEKELKPNDITLNTIIDIMVESGNFDLAWTYYDQMETIYNVEPDIFTYSTLLKSIKNYEPNQTNIERAFNILKIVKLSKTKGIKPDEILYNCILDTCVKYNRISQAESIFQDMKDAKIMPSKITYAIMIRGYGNDHSLEKAFEVFIEMKQSGIQANEIIYGCLLNACVKCSKIEKACEIYDEIQNSDIQMNIVLYSTLIKGYTRIKNFEKAFEIYNKLMQDISVQANTVTYNAILDCCVECGDNNMMNKIFEELRQNAKQDENAPQPDLITYSTVIKGYSRLKNYEKVLDIYNYLRGRDDIDLDEVIFNSILDGLLKSEQYNDALVVYEDMKLNKIKGSNATYSILIKIYSKMNNVTKAVGVYNEMLEESIKPSLITYTSIIQILIKSKRVQNAISIFDEILFNGLSPDHVMYNVIINGCVFNGRLDDACRFLLKSFTANLRLCNDVYKNILGNLLTNRIMNYNYKIELTMKICKELKSRGLKIDIELYYKVMKMIYKNNGKKCENFAQRETEEYQSSVNSHVEEKPKYYNNKKENYNNNSNSKGTWKKN